MKGIVLAGGSGTRLHPITLGVSKQLLPIYDKPMIYYPISILMKAGIRDILIISTPKDLPSFKNLLGSGEKFGVNFVYKEQPSPDGLAQAFILGENFIGKDNVCLILGDNIFYGNGLAKLMERAISNVNLKKTATIFGYRVKNPKRYGVVELDSLGNVLSIEEKPQNPKSNLAVVGLYFYTNEVIKIAKTIKPSKRGELEITSINNEYQKNNCLKAEVLDIEFTWLDTGTHDSLLEANNFIQTIEKRRGLKVACLEEIAFEKKFIDKNQLALNIKSLSKTSYSNYLTELLQK